MELNNALTILLKIREEIRFSDEYMQKNFELILLRIIAIVLVAKIIRRNRPISNLFLNVPKKLFRIFVVSAFLVFLVVMCQFFFTSKIYSILFLVSSTAIAYALVRNSFGLSNDHYRIAINLIKIYAACLYVLFEILFFLLEPFWFWKALKVFTGVFHLMYPPS